MQIIPILQQISIVFLARVLKDSITRALPGPRVIELDWFQAFDQGEVSFRLLRPNNTEASRPSGTPTVV